MRRRDIDSGGITPTGPVGSGGNNQPDDQGLPTGDPTTGFPTSTDTGGGLGGGLTPSPVVTRGGGTIKSGCTIRGAINYDPTAVIPDDASCIFEDQFEYFSSTTETTNIRFSIKSTPIGASILVDEKLYNQPNATQTPGIINYTVQDLLTPKIIKVEKSNFVSNSYYRISVEKKKKPLYSSGFDDAFDKQNSDTSNISVVAIINYYLLKVEKFKDGEWNIEKIQGYNPDISTTNIDVFAIENILKNLELPKLVDLPFNLVDSDYINPPRNLDNTVYVTTTNPLPDGVRVGYQLKGYDSFDNVIGFLQPGINRINWGSDIHQSIFFYFDNVNLDNYETKFSLPATTYLGPNTFIEGIDYELELKSNGQVIGILIERKNNPIKEPILYFDFPNAGSQTLLYSNFVNLANPDEIFTIPYRTENAELVKFTIGNTTREYPPNGSITLTVSDFYDGIGTYLVFLQPFSKIAGFGVTKKLTIFAQKREILPGPDIRTIFYPQIIEGADFKGYDIDFNINWNAVNTNYTLIYVTKKSDETLLGKINPTSILPNEFVDKNNSGIDGKTPTIDINKRTNTKLTLKIADVLRKAGKELDTYNDVTQFDLILIPVNTEGDVIRYGVEEKITITFDKGDVIPRETVVELLRSGFYDQLDFSVLDTATSRLLTHLAHFGNADNKLIANWDIDKETYSVFKTNEDGVRQLVEYIPTLVLKMYEPLPKEITPNQILWISKIQSLSKIEDVRIIDKEETYCIALKPNFKAELTDDLGYSLYDSIISENSVAGEKIVNEYINKTGFSLTDLDLNYVKDITYLSDDSIYYPISQDYAWENFVKYSSAKQRVDNFIYKIQMLESYNEKIDLITTDTNTIAANVEVERIQSNIKKIKGDFDGFERFLTETPDSYLAYPGAGGAELSSSLSEESYNWYVSASLSADEYDKNNPSNIINNVPNHIKNESNESFLLFFNMIGQHFDLMWAYTKSLSNIKKVEHKHDNGIFDTLIPYMLESLGWDLETDFDSQALWEFAFGYLNKDGDAKSSLSGKERKNQVWRRILNNLPYIYKHKGTKRALYALMACYGLPASTLTFTEYGGTSNDADTFAFFTFDDKSSSLKFTGKESIKIPWKQYAITGDHANTIELRFNTSIRGNYIIAQTDNTWKIGIVPVTGSLIQAKVEFTIESGGNDVSVSTINLPIFNDNYFHATVTKQMQDSKELYTLYVNEAFQQRIRNYDVVSMSLDLGSTSWKSGSNIEIGSGAHGNYVGNVDEVRLWSTPLNSKSIQNHTLTADAIDGNSYSASTEDLIFRLDFEYPKNRNVDPNILNVAINQEYEEEYATAVGFDSITDYPYNYEVYDRELTVKVPSTGITFSDKIKIQDQKIVTDLSYNSRATKRIADTTHSDSNKFGMFLSPTKEINMDIIKGLGAFNIDNFIGDPSDSYSDRYKDLDVLRSYYFNRYKLNIHEYIQLVRYIDKSFFKVLETVIPARAKVASGLLIEPHILQRSKTVIKKPIGEKNHYETNAIDFNNDLVFDIDYNNLETTLTNDEAINLSVDYKNIETQITNIDDTLLEAETANYEGNVEENLSYDVQSDIVKSKNSDTAAIHIDIDANILQAISSQFDSDKFITAGGFTYEDTAVGGFRFWGIGAHTILTEIDSKGQITKRRMRAYRLKQKYTVETPTNDGIVLAEQYRYKITLLPIEFGVQYILKYIDFYEERMILEINGVDTEFGIGDIDLEDGIWNLTYPYLSINPADTQEYKLITLDMINGTITFTTSLFSFGAPVNVRPEIKNEVVGVEDLLGSFRDYAYNHYDKPTGLQRSFDEGSKQTAETTPDGGPAVVTFTTNPNTLRVNQSGRGSGEPILEVD